MKMKIRSWATANKTYVAEVYQGEFRMTGGKVHFIAEGTDREIVELQAQNWIEMYEMYGE